MPKPRLQVKFLRAEMEPCDGCGKSFLSLNMHWARMPNLVCRNIRDSQPSRRSKNAAMSQVELIPCPGCRKHFKGVKEVTRNG